MYSMIIWSLLFCLIPTIESRKTTDMFVALRRWPLRSAPIFFLDHRMGLFFCWRDGISNYAVLFHFQDIPSAAKSLSPWILEELWDVEDMVTSSWCITSGHGKTWQAGKSALPGGSQVVNSTSCCEFLGPLWRWRQVVLTFYSDFLHGVWAAPLTLVVCAMQRREVFHLWLSRAKKCSDVSACFLFPHWFKAASATAFVELYRCPTGGSRWSTCVHCC